MSKLVGVFDNFTNLGSLSAEEINRWLYFKVETHVLENFLANRLLYPQSIATTDQEMEIDLAILREAARRNPGFFYNGIKQEVTIQKVFEERFAPIQRLIRALSDVLPLKGVVRILIKDAMGAKLVGSIIVEEGGPMESVLLIEGKELRLRKGSVMQIPLEKRTAQLKLDGALVAVFGGRAGVFVDLREKR